MASETARAPSGRPEPPDPGPDRQRVDRWLFFARIVKSRTLAQKLCEAGHVRINRVKIDSGAKPVRPGDALTISLSSGIRVLRVASIGSRRGPPPEARTLYEDLLAVAPEEGTEGN